MNFLTRPYVIRPQPESGESLIGYMLRIARLNGRADFHELFKDFGSALCLSCFVVDSKVYDSVFAYFAHSVDMDEADFRAHFRKDECVEKIIGKLFYHPKVGAPKFCPHCLVENGFLKAKWQFLHVNHCEKHDCALFQKCPTCGVQQNWRSRLFSGCTNCYQLWQNVGVTKCSLPLLEKVVNGLPSHIELDYLEGLYKNLTYALRANDAIHTRYGRALRDVEMFGPYFELAHKLTVLERVRREFTQHRKRRFATDLRIRPQEKILRKIDLSIAAVNDSWFNNMQMSDETVIPTEVCYTALTVTRVAQHAANDSRYYLDWRSAEKVLEMDRPYILHLIKAGLLPLRTLANVKSRVSPPAFNDIAVLYKLFQSVVLHKSKHHGEGLVTLESATKMLVKTRSKKSYLVIAAYLGHVRVYSPCHVNNFAFSELLFDAHEVKRICITTIDDYIESRNNEFFEAIDIAS